MSEIYIIYSKMDEDIINFFSRIFNTSKNVKPIFQELERIVKGDITREKIVMDIDNSNAVFMLLSQNILNNQHTRDWVTTEGGVARNKDVWRFEHCSQAGKIPIVTLFARHYVIFDTNDYWFKYINEIIESYDDSCIIKNAVTMAGIGAAIGSTKGVGGGILGACSLAILSKLSSDKELEDRRPRGDEINHIDCHSIYEIHPLGICEFIDEFMCPICNKYLRFIR